jgi:hypothetical protein
MAADRTHPDHHWPFPTTGQPIRTALHPSVPAGCHPLLWASADLAARGKRGQA